jgi:hypothetical protein
MQHWPTKHLVLAGTKEDVTSQKERGVCYQRALFVVQDKGRSAFKHAKLRAHGLAPA